MNKNSRFIIGIDLGTTNSAVSFVDMEPSSSDKRIKIFQVPQLTGPGEFNALPVLPSFLYIPGQYDINKESMSAPWVIAQRSRDDQNFAGAFARDHGISTPSRLVSSAKSWLCHDTVDKRARILPWNAPDEIYKVSPVQATASYLNHIRCAWNTSKGDDDELYLENQTVIITVPASFDEVARDLTLEAAQAAGYSNPVLLEEPLAAFYNWLIRNETKWSDHVKPDELILVCDVGGGTTDFTLIALKEKDGGPRFERIAVGDHLILGGDNIDMALATAIRQKLSDAGKSISHNRFKSLCHQCRKAKEDILDNTTDSARITLLGSGSGLIAGTISEQMTKKQVDDIVLNLFFPTDFAAEPDKPATPDHDSGLMFETNPSITHHLSGFLERHADEVKKILGKPIPCPDHILFNGGSLKSDRVKNNILSAVENRFRSKGGKRPNVLANENPDTAVAKGAAYYGLVKTGTGVKVGSGSPRSYYIGVDKKSHENKHHALCIVERGLDEGSTITIKESSIDVLANRPVIIDLYSSSYRSGDKSGDLVEVDATMTRMPPLKTIIQFGQKSKQSDIPVRIEALYTETGSLEIWCRSTISRHKWKLSFHLRGTRDQTRDPIDVQDTEIFDADLISNTCDYVKQVFSRGTSKNDLNAAAKKIAEITGRPKYQWPLGLLRSIADTLLDAIDIRKQSQAFESRWLNLTGFCLRPGFGDAFDPSRITKLWRIYKKGPVHAKTPQVRSEWWIMWRRVAGGLNPGRQRQFIQDVAPVILSGKGLKSKQLFQEAMEIWMAIANMEGLYVKDKVKLGNRLLSDINPKNCKPQLLWSLSRIGARDLLYGSIDRVVPPESVSPWIKTLLNAQWRGPKPVSAALCLMAGKTRDRLRDIEPDLLNTTIKWLEENSATPEQIQALLEPLPVQQKKTRDIFGESLPSGIRLGADL